MIRKRSLGFIAAALVAAGATTAICCGEAVGLVSGKTAPFGDALPPAPAGSTSRPLDVLGDAKPWLTAVPGGPQSLRGKVVIVNFWTYSCINSLRALPYLEAWSERYTSQGLVVVGAAEATVVAGASVVVDEVVVVASGSGRLNDGRLSALE